MKDLADEMHVEKFYIAINIAILLLVTSFTNKLLGFLDKPLTSFYISILILILLLITLYKDRKKMKIERSYKFMLAIVFIILSIILAFSYNFYPLYPLISISILFFGLGFLRRSNEEDNILLAASILCVIFSILMNKSSTTWFIINGLSQIISKTVTSFLERSSLISSPISGFPLFLFSLIISILLIIGSRRTRWDYIFPFTLLFIWLSYVIIIGTINFKSNSDTARYLPFLFFILAIVLFIQAYRSQFKEIRSYERKRAYNTIIFLLVLISMILMFVSPSQLLPIKGKRILFYGENMLGTWDVPEYGKYGELAAGMFGLLPYYLETYGYNCTIFTKNLSIFLERNQPIYENLTRYVNLTEYVNFVESEMVTPDILKGFDVFVVINLNTSFSDEEKKAIWGFVEEGGSLLVLGDHTGMDNLMSSLNDLIRGNGITIRFDSAMPLDQMNSWLTCYHKMDSPLTFGLSDEEIEISIGASLNITPPAYPVITGDFAFSDYGDITNAEKAFLGDYRYNKGELLGEVVLVAGCYYGKGRVLVFGDTTTFQNPSLPLSHRFVSRVFNWLVNGSTAGIDISKQTISLILFIFAFVLSFKNKEFRAVPPALLIGIFISIILNSYLIIDASPSGPLIYVDSSHTNSFSISTFNSNSLSGTMINFARNGYLPVLLNEFNQEKINKASILLIVAPNKPISDGETDTIMKFIKDGGLVILSAGYRCRDAVKPLLDAFKLDINNVPLGPVPYVEENLEEHQLEPKFVDAWPIIVMNKSAVSYYDLYIENQTYTLITFIKYEKGGFILVADNEFFLDKNVETTNSIWPGNVQFIKSMIDDVREKGVEI